MNKVHNGNDALEVIMTCFKRKGWTNAHSSRIYYIKFITFDSLLYILYRVFWKESAKTPITLSTFTIFNEFHNKNFEPQFRWCNNSTHLAMIILLKNVLRWPVKIIFGELSTIWENKWNCGVLVKLLNFNKLSPPRMYFLSI